MTPAEIAAKLTPAQIKVLRCEENGRLSTRWNLYKRNLFTDWIIEFRTLTPLGYQVLAALNAKDTT